MSHGLAKFQTAARVALPKEEWLVPQTDFKRRMPRRAVWIDEIRFRGFGCSECAWVFNASGSPTGKSFDEAMRNFELQRDREFHHMFAPIIQGTPASKAESNSREAR